MKNSISIFFLLISVSGFPQLGYNFNQPVETYNLPSELIEISGLELKDNKTTYCIQDEKGTVYEYDLESRKVKTTYEFTGKGDFEGVAYHTNAEKSYVLKSDGSIYEMEIGSENQVYSYPVKTPCTDMEALCFTEDGNELLLGCKDGGKDDEKRSIYRVTNQFLAESFLEIDWKELESVGKELGVKTKKFEFSPSAIGIHPLTKDVYILSASKRFIAVFRDKKPISITALPKSLFYQPEGLAFFPNGDLLISSEGNKKKEIPGKILKYSYQKPK